MKSKSYLIFGGLLALLFVGQPALAQSPYMRATITGAPGDGKCTFEVTVDGSADLEIHGDQGDLRTTSGRLAQWRRLVCNQPLPNNPANFRFQGVDGRGSQQLVRDPNSSGGVAVIRINDPKAGSEGYTGDITWRGGNYHYGGIGNWSSGRVQEQQRQQAQQRQNEQQGQWGQQISRADAVNVCRNQVVATRNVPLNRVRATPAAQTPDGDTRVNFTFVNPYGGSKSGYCDVSGSGQILEFQVDQNTQNGRASWNQALNTCQREVAKNFGVAEENVRVQHGTDPGNGNFLINYQAQDRAGRIRTGACSVSPTGDIEEFRRW